MKKIFITGGSGTIGKAFIDRNYNKYKFYSFARSEKMQVALKRRFPKIEIILGTIDDENFLISTVRKISPDIIIHAAALKHVDTAEKQPLEAVKTNVVGSANIIKAAQSCGTPLTVAISTDKACQPDCVYGYTKLLMEKLFLEASNETNFFACCRFGNVAGSHGSVIPFWLSLKSNNQKIKLTDPRMNRLMFLPSEATDLIEKTIEMASSPHRSTFVLSKKMKNVNMYELAKIVCEEIEVVGLRPGEKLNEDLISDKELPYTRCDEEGYVVLQNEVNKNLSTRLQQPLSSKSSPNMTTEEIQDLVNAVKEQLSETLLIEKQY